MAEQGAGTPPGDADRRLQEAMARSPELATMMAARPPRRWRGRARWFAFAGAIAAAAVIVALAGRRGRAPPAPAEPAGPRDVALLPLHATPDPATGEAVAPFSGFAVEIDTEPPGALVEVAGVSRGEAPVMAGLECKPGDVIAVRAVHPRAGEARATVRCRTDALVRLTLRLGRAR